ncbi:impB/mucB/samB family protein [Metarhizium brunneum]
MSSLAESLTRVTEELCGRSAVQKWKCTQGKAKPWRRNTFLGRGGEIEGIPASLLRLYAGIGSSYLSQCKRNCKHKRFELKLEYEAHRELDDKTGRLYDLDAEKQSWEWKPEDVKRLLTERVDASLESSHIPYEAYVGSILGEQFQLGRLISEGEHWGEAVYQVTALLAPNKAPEARSYCLTGLPREQLVSIKRRMKRLHRKYGVSKIDQARKKFLVYYRNSPSNTPGGERESERRLGASTSTKDRMNFRISNYDYESPALLETNSPQHTRMAVWTKERSWAFPDQSLSCEESINESSARDNHAAEEPKPPSSGQNPVVSSNILDSCAARSPLRRGRRRRPRKSKAKVSQLASPGETLHDTLAIVYPDSEIHDETGSQGDLRVPPQHDACVKELGSLTAMHEQLNNIAQNIATLSDRLAEQHHLVETARQFVRRRAAWLSQTMDKQKPGMALDEEALRFLETYYLARAKLSRDIAQPNHDLRFLVGHANLLNSLMLQLAT